MTRQPGHFLQVSKFVRQVIAKRYVNEIYGNFSQQGRRRPIWAPARMEALPLGAQVYSAATECIYSLTACLRRSAGFVADYDCFVALLAHYARGRSMYK